MRLVKALLAAGALAAIVAAPTRAQDYTKTTLFTFSHPVQLPGMTLPAGEYMLKIANPEGGRRAIGVWDKDGGKFYGMALTVADESMRRQQNPSAHGAIVLFGEAPAGEPQAVRSWFYEGDSIGYEFIYPNAQAVKIARASGVSVLATAESTQPGSQVGRVDRSGQFSTSSDATASTTTTTTTTTTTSAADAQPAAPAVTATATASAPTQQTPSTTASAQAPEPTANRTEPQTPAAPATTARAATAPAEPRAVGTSGQDAATLPQTAGAGTLVQLTGLALLGAGAMLRSLRRRFAAS